MEPAEPKLNTSRIALWLILFAVIVAGGFAITKQKETKAITLGAILPLTGSGADQAEWIKRGFELALENSKSNIKIVYEDSGGDTQKALSAYKKLREQFVIPAVLTWGSGIGIALTPLVNEDKVIQMGVATAANAYGTPNDFTFRNFPKAAQEADFISSAVLGALNTKDITILKINNDYGKSSADSFKEQFVQKGGRVAAEEVFAPNTTDFRTHLAKLKSLSPKLIYLATYPKEGGLLIKQARELGLSSRFIASVAILGGKEFFDIAGGAAEGLVVVTSMPPFSATSEDIAISDFVEKYRKKYGENPEPQQLYTARAYDALKILETALKLCNADTACLRDELFKVQNYKGVGGTFSFDRNGDVSAEFNLQQVKNGKFVPLAK